jgi:hypothetical protein
MARLVALVAACAGAGALATVASPAVPQPSAAVSTSSTRAGAKPVALTVTLTLPTRCGDPGKTPLILTLPRAMARPTFVAPASVLLNGRQADSVQTKGQQLVISMKQPGFIRCSVVGVSTLTITIARRAGLGNPKAPGIYSFPVSIGVMHGTPKLRIT